MAVLQASLAAKPAGGAEAVEIAIAAGAATLGYGGLFVLAHLHRRGRSTPLGWAAGLAARVTGLPVWAALPLLVAAASLAGVYFGFMWDASLHLDNGRDQGPLANPAHYFLLSGLFGNFAAGFLAMALPGRGDDVGPSAVRLGPSWRAPAGGVMIAGAGVFAFSGFPLDDVSHRLFGQDVTLWGPTHLLMLGGAVLSLVGVAVLFAEATRGGWRALPELERVPMVRNLLPPLREVLKAGVKVVILGALLIGLSAFLTEFDYGIPQFQLVFQPAIIALCAGLALVAVRLWAGRGAALAAVAFYLAARGIVAALVGPLLGETTPAMPLFLGEAICVEPAALALARRGPLVVGAASGLLIGTVGFASEWPWIDAVMPIAWTDALLPEGAIAAAVAGLAGGVAGGLLGAGLLGQLPRPRIAHVAAIAALAAVAAVLANGALERTPANPRATVVLEETRPGPEREALATVQFHPWHLAEGATWVRAIAWQGGSPRVGFALRRVSEGLYRTREPLPIHGDWKVGLRIANGRTMLGVPVYLPADPGIPAAEVPALPRATRAMQPDRELLQRERRQDVPGWLWAASSLVVLVLALGLFFLLAWGVDRFAGSREPAEAPLRPRLGIESRPPVGAPS